MFSYVSKVIEALATLMNTMMSTVSTVATSIPTAASASFELSNKAKSMEHSEHHLDGDFLMESYF